MSWQCGPATLSWLLQLGKNREMLLQKLLLHLPLHRRRCLWAAAWQDQGGELQQHPTPIRQQLWASLQSAGEIHGCLAALSPSLVLCCFSLLLLPYEIISDLRKGLHRLLHRLRKVAGSDLNVFSIDCTDLG